MRITLSHRTTYAYRNPQRAVLQNLRLTPRNHDGQYVQRWRIEVDHDAHLRQDEDSYGNIVHRLDVSGPIESLSILVEGEVETHDTAGIIANAVERFPTALYKRSTELTQTDAAMRAYAETVAAGFSPAETIPMLHALSGSLYREMRFDTAPTSVTTTAVEAFALKAGVCQDLTHVLLGMARHLGFPARYVSGYFHRADGMTEQDAGHAWAEVYVPAIGWVSFDPANGISGTPAHIRLAIGLDYLGAAPVRGSRTGHGEESLDVTLQVYATQQ
jgi:transglutaminase-like putative cysteine protease